MWLWLELKALTYMLKQCLVYNKLSINSSYSSIMVVLTIVTIFLPLGCSSMSHCPHCSQSSISNRQMHGVVTPLATGKVWNLDLAHYVFPHYNSPLSSQSHQGQFLAKAVVILLFMYFKLFFKYCMASCLCIFNPAAPPDQNKLYLIPSPR